MKAIVYPALYPGNKFPTSISHLIGLTNLKNILPFPLVRVQLQNTGTTTASNIVLESVLSNYSTGTKQTITLAAGASKVIDLTPGFNYTNLFAVTSDVPGNIITEIKHDAKTVYSKTQQVTILNRNSLDLTKADPYTAVFVTPNDKKGAIKSLLAAASKKMPYKSIGGYLASYAKPLTTTVKTGYYYTESIYMYANEKICITMVSVTNSISLTAMTYANFNLFTAGKTPTLLLDKTVATNDKHCFSAASTGWYNIVYEPWWIFDETITRSRDASHHEVVNYQGEAIFNTLKEMKLTYVSTPGGTTWWNAIQNINFPTETISSTGGNCIDGTLVFASAFEALGMRPLIIFRPGHAYIGVYLWTNEDIVLLIETTLVGTGTYSYAQAEAGKDFAKYQALGSLTTLDIEKSRQNGITPAPM